MDDKLLKAILLCFDKSPEDAVKFLESQGIMLSWDWREQLEAIREHCFTVAKVASADALQILKDHIDKSIKDGLTYQEFKKSVFAELSNNGFPTRGDNTKWRLDTIYRTNMQSAYMAGRYEQMRKTEDAFPYWEGVAVLDKRTTDKCKHINGVVLPANDSFWTANYPPNHYRCRSRVRSLSVEDVKRRGIKIANSDDFKNIKPDKGFDNPPGQWKPDLSKYSPEIKNALSKVLG